MTATAQAFTSAPAELPEPPELPGAGRRRPLAGLLRTWRQLTSMRTALQLLFLLAVAAVPGSVLPQRGVSPIRVQQFLAAHHRLGPFLDRLDGFDVFAAPWFAAVYALLMISLIGCLVPRIRLHARAAVRRPPKAPAHPSRLSTGTSWVCDQPVEVVLAQARTVLRRRRFRTTADSSSVAAEKGYLRETGNLAFHVALGLLLVGVALGSLRGYSGTVLVVEGKAFSNTVVDYDQFKPGALLDTARLQPFTFALDRFSAAYRSDGTPTYFGAQVSYQSTPTAPTRRQLIQVNHPLRLGETKVYLIGHGYAPHVVLRDRTGVVVYDDAPPCDPTASVGLDSTCVVKIPDTGLPPAGPRRIPQQLALYGPLTPTPPPDGSPLSTSPQLTNPVLRLQVLLGDLHLDAGNPQNVYTLDRSAMRVVPVNGPSGRRNPVGQLLHPDDPGQRTMTNLPGGMTLTVDSIRNWSTFAVKNDPGKGLVLWAAVTMLLGLVGSLLIRRRRVWLRATSLSYPGTEADGAAPDAAGGPTARTTVELGALTRTGDLADEFEDILKRMQARLPPCQEPPQDGPATAGRERHGPPGQQAVTGTMYSPVAPVGSTSREDSSCARALAVGGPDEEQRGKLRREATAWPPAR